MFKRRPKPPINDADLRDRIAKPPAQPMASLSKLLPIRHIIDQVVSVVRDPNGKISSKRAGAGALITAGILFLQEGQLPAGITCLGFATALFFLTKFDPQP